MDHFLYRGEELFAEDVAVAEIANSVGTPCYVYSRATLERHYRVYREALGELDGLVCFAVKANSNLAVLN
ncbi:MAG: diaminopimelate decarboxylase, partial [Gammaproteobacteria bacterium]|nr:diaminopimelate decarboxylase [Gammaproteobacteria bacterium]